jgi:hypothetical protein
MMAWKEAMPPEKVNVVFCAGEVEADLCAIGSVPRRHRLLLR